MGSGAQRILVVDDHERVLAGVRRVLESQGYRVTTASDGVSALKQAVEQLPDLIVLDILLPLVDGYEVARRLRRHEPTSRIPILMLSAIGRIRGLGPKDERRVSQLVEEQAAGFAAGASDYLAKPVTGAELLRAVRRLLF